MTNRAHEQALRTGHTCGDANDTTEPHTIAYASYSIIHIMPARKLVCELRVYMYGVWHADGTRRRTRRRSHAVCVAPEASAC